MKVHRCRTGTISRQAETACLLLEATGSLHLDLNGLIPPWGALDAEGHSLALQEALEAITLDGLVVNEQILACFSGDEAKAFFVVEPFDGAGGHGRFSLNEQPRRWERAGFLRG